MDVPQPDRIFSESEASELLQKAVALQEASAQGGGYKPGITWTELNRIAEEAGVDRSFLEQALTAPIAVKKEKNSFFSSSVERVVQGELPADKFDVILEAARPMQTSKVLPSQVGRTLRSNTWMGWNQAAVEVSARGGRTRIKVGTNALIPYFAAVHAPFILSIIALAGSAQEGNPLAGLVIAGGLMLLSGFFFTMMMRKGRQQAVELADRLAEVVMEECPVEQASTATPVYEDTQAELRENI
jgi:hypothetical protein